jgi:hypothetical protein
LIEITAIKKDPYGDNNNKSFSYSVLTQYNITKEKVEFYFKIKTPVGLKKIPIILTITADNTPVHIVKSTFGIIE